MWVFPVIVILILLLGIYQGLKIMRRREYIGYRQVSLVHREKVSINGQAAYLIGLAYVLGFSIILSSIIVVYIIGNLISIEAARLAFSILVMMGLIILFGGFMMGYLASFLDENADDTRRD